MGKALYLLLSKFLPSCREVARLASESCERTLTRKEKFLIKIKCMICIYSDRYVKQIDLMHSQIKEQSNRGEDALLCDVYLSDEKKTEMKNILGKRG